MADDGPDGTLLGGLRNSGTGFTFVAGTVGNVARKLDAAGTQLEARAGSAPPAPDSGVVSAAVDAVLGVLAESLDGIVTGLDAAASAVVHSIMVPARPIGVPTRI